MKDEINFEYEQFNYIIDLQETIDICQSLNHVQQVSYSTYHRALTQICFDCKKVRSNIKLKQKTK